jgi:hypothetical protein
MAILFFRGTRRPLIFKARIFIFTGYEIPNVDDILPAVEALVRRISSHKYIRERPIVLYSGG